MNPRRRIEGVIFDLDGVLVATDELHLRAWRRLAEEEGIPFDDAIGVRLRGLGRMESLNVVLEPTARAYTPDEKRLLAERKNGYYRELIRLLGPTDVLPGAVRLLNELKSRGVKTAVASSSRNARPILEAVGLTTCFDAIVDGTDSARSKPDPELFLLAADRIGLRPGQCLVVEDALSGVEGARRAGMAVLGISAGNDLPGVEPVVASLADLSIDALLARR